MKYMLKVLSMFEMGQRDNQEDCMFPQPGEATGECRSFILCDGMGGHDSGEVASNAVCCAMGGYLLSNCEDDVPFTKEVFLEALNFAYSELDARDTKAVKKTLSIPEWLNEEALALGINFSQVLQEALLQKIGQK